MEALEKKKPNGSDLVLTAPEPRPETPMELLSLALRHNAAIDVIERLSLLQEKAQARDAEMSFNDAMNRAQSELGRIAPDLDNPQTKSKYASYSALDRILRPIYTRNGFSLSFDSGDSQIPDTVKVICYVSHRDGHTRKYQGPPMPADGKGAKGGDVMTKTHATGAAMSYGMRYLLKFIFNVAIGEDDRDGNAITNGNVSERIEYLENCSDINELKKLFAVYYKEFANSKAAQKAIVDAYETKKREFGNGR